MNDIYDAVQGVLLLLLVGLAVLLWLRSQALGRELLELRSTCVDCSGKLHQLAEATASCSSRLAAVHAEVTTRATEVDGLRSELVSTIQADRDAAAQRDDSAAAALERVHEDVADLRDAFSTATIAASAARAEGGRRQAQADQERVDMSARLRDLEGRMGDFVHGCDELVRVEIAAQLADALPVLAEPAET